MFNIAIMGCGVVGSGVADILLDQEEKLTKRFNQSVKLTKILDLRDFTGTRYEKLMTGTADDIINDNDISAVVVTIGGLDFAYNMCKKSLLAGKHVVTSNKEVVAAYGQELTQIAFDKGIRFLFEASAGGGIPVIRPINICLSGNNINEIQGILNGTTNYILTRMSEDGVDFASALKEAQAKGYAEADPTADVDGFDAARKIAILSAVAYGKFVDYNKVDCTGIRKVTTDDIEVAKSRNCSIKLIAGSTFDGEKVTATVEPCFVKNSNLLSSVNSVFNAVLTKGSYTGDTLFYGKGAGKEATASAVVGDIIEILCGGDKLTTLPEYVNNNAIVDNNSDAKYDFCIVIDCNSEISYEFAEQVSVSDAKKIADELAERFGGQVIKIYKTLE